jgi:hypothetical protein
MSTKANESPSNQKPSESLTSPTGILADGFPPAVWTPESRKAHHDLILKAINENPD